MTPDRPSGLDSLQGDQLQVMSCNIRLDRSADDTGAGDPDYWPERAPALAALLASEDPTVLGIQEGLFHQLPVIAAALPHHRMVGYGKGGGSQNQHCGIYYDTRRLDLLGWDQFWLSPTPQVIGSTGWGNLNPRIVTWARLRDRRTGAEFVHANTHFDHRSEAARVNSAAALLDLVREFQELPVVITGDFNAAESSPVYRQLIGSGILRDGWVAAEEQVTPAWGTFPNYADPVVGGDRIDWLLLSTCQDRPIRVRQAAVNPFRLDGRHPSDHLPLQAVIEL